jgi:hypothetical protein
VPTIDENLQTGISFCVGSALTPLLDKKMKGKHSNSLVELEGQGSIITRTQRVGLARVRDTPGDTQVILRHNERTRDEHGNTCV